MTSVNSGNNTPDGTEKRPWRKRKWVATGIAGLVTLVLLLFIAQEILNRTWGTEQVAQRLSRALNTEVSIGEMELNILKGIQLRKVLIRDHHQDTLIYADYLKSGLSGALISALSGQLHLQGTEIHDGLFNLVTYEGENRRNIAKTFSPEPREQKQKGGLIIAPGTLNLENFEFRNHDYNRGSEEFYKIGSGEIDIHLLDLVRDSLEVDHIFLDHLSIYIHMFMPANMDTSSSEDELTASTDTSIQRSPFFLSCADIDITNSRFKLDNNFRSPEWNRNYERINYDHLLLDNVNISVCDLKMQKLAFKGRDLYLSFESPAGFELQYLKVDDAVVDSTQVALNGMTLLSPTSSLGDSITFKFNCYESWRNFNNEVFIDARIDESELSFRDIMTFAPDLYDNTFFINSENQILELDGHVFGRVNSLKARDLTLEAGDDISFMGNVSTRDLTVRNEELLSLDIEELRFDINSLENMVPNLDIPQNFEKLGVLRYKGRFDGYFEDFVTYGNLRSNLGRAVLDMRLDLKPGRDLAEYSGKMQLVDFDVGRWTNNPDLGQLSMSINVQQGKGLTLDNANAEVEGVVNKLEYKGYAYENLEIDGKLTRNLFDGLLIADSEDAKLRFNGKISNLDSVPVYKFYADIDHIRLKALNLSEKPFDFGGIADISLTGLSWDELIGQAKLVNTWALFNGQDSLNFEQIDITQLYDSTGTGRRLTMNSNFGDIELQGVYDIPSIHQDMLNIIGHNHPKLSELLGIDSLTTNVDVRQDYSIDIDLKNNFDLVNYFTNDQYRIGKVEVTAYVNTVNESLKYQSEISTLGIGNWDISNLDLSLVNDDELLLYTLRASQVAIREKPWFDSLSHVTNLKGDSGTFKLSYIDPQGIFEGVDIEADMLPSARELKIQFEPSSLWFDNKVWSFSPGNSLVIKKEGLAFDNFVMKTDTNILRIDDINNQRGIEAKLDNWSSDVLDSLTQLETFDFKGYFDAHLTIQDLFDFKKIDFDLHQDSTLVNSKNRGTLDIKASGASLEKGIDISLELSDGRSELIADGKFKKGKGDSQSEFAFQIDANEFPLEILEDIITTGISNTRGYFTGEFTVQGVGNEFDVLGDLYIPSGRSRVDYVGVTYYFEDQTIYFKNDYIDFNNVTFSDSLDNIATVTGGLRHNSLKEWELDLSISSDRLIGLNTTRVDNPTYYGYAIGEIDLEFYGTMENPSIDVVASTGAPSELVIPISYGTSEVQTGFVEFVKMDTTSQDSVLQRATTLKGLELDMKLSVYEGAKSKIIFDEQAGDILEGYGRGNLNIQISRSGEMAVYGDYEIEHGDYLFTLLNFVNKPFRVKRGGSIRWTGDPLDALIDIEAEYKGLTAAPYPLIQEYLSEQNSALLTEARRPSKVDLTMGLSGSLMSPRITFEIDMPNLVGELNTYVNNKLSSLENDQDQLNQQVFGLVVFGSFLPSTQQTALVSNIGASTINTLSEFLSTQLSFFVSSLLNDVVDDVKFISGIDFDLAYVQQQYNLESSGRQTSFSEGEYQFRFKNRLWNDKWIITVGGDYGSQSIFNNDPYFNPETVIEWNTPVNGLKLRIYYRAEQSFQGQSQRVGGGIRYRKEFDNFFDFKKALKDVDAES